MQKLVLIALAGAAGTLSRYWLAGAVQRMAGPAFPFGTFTVNILGSFLFGLVWGFVEYQLPTASSLRLVVLTGFMGAFTTFSTYMFETASLVRAGDLAFALANVLGQVVVGFLAVSLGLWLTRAV